MNLSRRTFVAGSVAGMVGLAGCGGNGDTPSSTATDSPQADLPTDESMTDSDAGETESWEVTTWENPNSNQVYVEADSEVSDDGSEFTFLLRRVQTGDYVWVIVESNDADPEGGWFTDASDVAPGILDDYGAVEGSVLLNENNASGGLGTECGVNLDGADNVTITLIGGLEGDTVMDEVEVLEVHSLSKG